MKTIADLIARVKEIDHFTNSDFAAEARQLLPAVVEMLEECMRQRDYYVHTSDTWTGHIAENNRELLEIAKKHGVL